MPASRSTADETASIDFLVSLIRDSEAQAAFDKDRWTSLKMRLAVTPALDLAGVAAKLLVVQHGIQTEANQLDLDILKSAITDLQRVSKTTGRP